MKKLIRKFKDWYQKFNTARWNAGLTRKYFPESKYVVEYAFEVAGVKYFTMSDIANIPYERGLMALAIYEEHRMKCDREYLLEHCAVMSDILRDKNAIDIFKINMLNDQLKERLEMNIDVDILYKLASVSFFDKNENPVLYDPEYNRKKIEFWKKHKGVADFFLQQSIRNFLPFLTQFDPYLESYLTLSQELNKIHLDRMSLMSYKSLSTSSTTGKKRSKIAGKT